MGRMFLARLGQRPCYGGLDLAAVSDLTGFVLAWPVRNFVYIYPWAWIPEEGVADRQKRDNVPYADWVRRGYIETTPGAVTDWRFVTARIKQLCRMFNVQEIGFDRYGARDTISDLMEDEINVVEIGQGFISMNAPARRLEELVLSKRLVHTGHPVLRWCMECTRVISDASANIKPVKPDRQKSSKRIDLTVAMLMAMNSAMRAEPEAKMSYTPLQSVSI